jgi:hypothetical protein
VVHDGFAVVANYAGSTARAEIAVEIKERVRKAEVSLFSKEYRLFIF